MSHELSLARASGGEAYHLTTGSLRQGLEDFRPSVVPVDGFGMFADFVRKEQWVFFFQGFEWFYRFHMAAIVEQCWPLILHHGSGFVFGVRIVCASDGVHSCGCGLLQYLRLRRNLVRERGYRSICVSEMREDVPIDQSSKISTESGSCRRAVTRQLRL